MHAADWSATFPQRFLASGIGIGLSGRGRPGRGVHRSQETRLSGLAGGMVSTAQEVGAALGLAIIATAALARSGQVTHAALGATPPSVLLPRPQASSAARWWPAGFSIAAALAAGLLLRRADTGGLGWPAGTSIGARVRGGGMRPRYAARLLAIVRPEIE